MVLGYDEKRPSEKDYGNFLEKLVLGLERLGNKEISLMIYGSYVRGDCVPGRSDIDAIFTFNSDVIIDKIILSKISKILADAQKGNNIPFQVTVTDLITMLDGRFNSFDPNFKIYFEEEGRIIYGNDYRNLFNYYLATHSDQSALRFNLKKSRIGLLFSEHDLNNDYGKFLERFNKTLNAVSRGSKQILGMIDNKLRKNRFSALEEISEIFPEVNIEPLKKIKVLYNDLEKLDNLYMNPGELMEFWENSVTFFESLIKSYIDKY